MTDDAPRPLIEPAADAEPLVPRPPLAPAEPARQPERPPWGRWLAVAVAAVLAAWGVRWGMDAWEGVQATFEAQERWVAGAETAFETIPLLTDDEIALLRRSRNPRHVALAQDLGVGPPDTRAQADSLAARYDLVPIVTDSLYVVLPGRYSVSALTPSAAASLDSVAVRFRGRLAEAGLPPFRFSVSSVWRTGADQAALRGVNANAAAGRSSHEYGTTYDITYNPTRYSPAPDAPPPPPRIDPRVPGVFEGAVRAALAREQAAALGRLAADYPSRLTAALGRALIELEDDGVLVVVRERRQPVFHVTLARRLVAPAP